MPLRCVVYGCGNYPDPEKGISLHKIPFYNDDRPEAVKRRRLWVRFVQRRRAEPNAKGKSTIPWKASSESAICSKHFKDEDFSRRFHKLPGQSKALAPRLKKDEFGISVHPTVQDGPETEQTSTRDHRMVCLVLLSYFVY